MIPSCRSGATLEHNSDSGFRIWTWVQVQSLEPLQHVSVTLESERVVNFQMQLRLPIASGATAVLEITGHQAPLPHKKGRAFTIVGI